MSRYQSIAIFIDTTVLDVNLVRKYKSGMSGMLVFFGLVVQKSVDDVVLWNCYSFSNLLNDVLCSLVQTLYNFFKLSSLKCDVATIVATISRFAVVLRRST